MRHNKWRVGIQTEMKKAAGMLTACSWGPFQIMFTVACELGFEGPQWELANPAVSIKYVIKLLNTRHPHRLTADTEDGRVIQLAKGYNAGSITARHTPTRYMTKVLKSYHKPDLFEGMVKL